MTDTSNSPLIFIVDDDEPVRTSMEFLLGSVGYTTRSCSSAEEFAEILMDTKPAAVLLDVRMHGMTGIEFLERNGDSLQNIPVIFITGHGDVPMAVQAMKLGAFDFLEKPVIGEQLFGALDRALGVQKERAEQASERAVLKERLETLTPREREVLEHVVSGSTSRETAVVLGISSRTVEVHRARIMEKMALDSFATLVRQLTHHRLL